MEAEKEVLRAFITTKLNEHSLDQRIKDSKQICTKLLSSEPITRSDTVLAYYPFKGEVDIKSIFYPLLKRGKELSLPHSNSDLSLTFFTIDGEFENKLVKMKWDLKEPTKEFYTPTVFDKDKKVVVLVPSVAFDLNRNRLGRGLGYYDRFLAEYKESVFTIGIAYDFQIVETLPTNNFDISVDLVVTPTQIF
ncbi:MAG: 5-formyltetrahydrofolate cyclo-ligase [Sphaerochaetaceae bacterium]|jgi:5-formyltetrahydrofolate cyclo-ligase